ncbi:Serine/threonine-protein kinase HT1 [Hordeum vulgare]|nr:Serine/threonine-protein kinase HT1 [Hordeum vulgare]
MFKEAKSASKRFSTPPPPPPEIMVSAARVASGRATEGAAQVDERAAAAAEKVLEGWTVDRKQLLIGHKFASETHSCLFHGIYKEVPGQLDAEQHEELASQLEKQFNTEIVTLYRLQHRNVVKVASELTMQ